MPANHYCERSCLALKLTSQILFNDAFGHHSVLSLIRPDVNTATIRFCTQIPRANRLWVFETFSCCWLCLAVCPKLLFYTLIMMTWQQATVQLVPKKWASLKFPPLNCNVDHCCGAFQRWSPFWQSTSGVVRLCRLGRCWKWIFMTRFLMNILIQFHLTSVFEVLMRGILPRAHGERKENVISKWDGSGRGVGTHGWAPEVALRGVSTHFLWPWRLVGKGVLKRS